MCASSAVIVKIGQPASAIIERIAVTAGSNNVTPPDKTFPSLSPGIFIAYLHGDENCCFGETVFLCLKFHAGIYGL
jgi:hypothetical protein